MRFSSGVSLRLLQPQTAIAMVVCDSVYRLHDCDMLVRFVCDGVHSPASLHPKGYAFDLRTHNVPPAELLILVGELRAALGDEFDVVLEDHRQENEHIHVEYDPD